VTITEMLARNGQMYPNDVALVQVTPSQNIRRQITWAEFDKKANRVANFLISIGVQKGDKVLLLMRNCIEWLVAYFGIIRTGAWVVPLNFRFTSLDIEFCANIAEPKVFILGEEFAERVEAIRPELSSIKDYFLVGQTVPQNMERLEEEIDEYSSSEPGVELKEEDTCGLYFTSGTTGTPKAVVFTHKNLQSAAISSAFRRNDQQTDVSTLIGPLYHTGTIMHWFGNLIVGGRGVLLVDKKIIPEYILEIVHQERVTELMLYVPWAQDLVSALEKGEVRKERYDLTCLRLMHLGAQTIPLSLVERLKSHFPNAQYIETYGLTESTGPGCICLVGIEKREGLIGRPGLNWEARIVNDQGDDIPPGEVGEIIVRGDGVRKEYYNNPEETAKTLKSGWLYTGDLGKVDEEGLFYIVARKKDVIISGGENIYPSDIESVLLRHPKVYDAALVGIPDDRLGELAVAVIEPKPGATLTEDEMNDFCEASFPRYRRPRKVIIGEVPRNSTGKIQKRALRQKYSEISHD